MDKDNTFQSYATSLVKNVPLEDIQYLINLFMHEAGVNMGNAVDEQTLERTIYHVTHDFGYLPVSDVASAFIRGSLGQFGAGRLVPRTIHGWLSEVSAEYNRMMVKERQEELNSDPIVSFNLQKFPIGKAILQKINWYEARLLSDETWDRVDLRKLAEAIGRKDKIEIHNFI
jgi:hypothetical protein